MIDSRKDITDLEKLDYLLGALEGEPKRMVEAYDYKAASYRPALQALERRVKKQRTNATTLINDIKGLKPTRPSEADDYFLLCDGIRRNINRLQSETTYNVNEQYNVDQLMEIIEAKLHLAVRERWRQHITSYWKLQKPSLRKNKVFEFIDYFEELANIKDDIIPLPQTLTYEKSQSQSHKAPRRYKRENVLATTTTLTYNLAARKVVDRLGHAADIILEHISDAINGLHQLLYNHLHPTFISLEAIKTEFSELEPKLRASNMRLFDLSPISVYHYPLSVYRLNNEVRYILHVPISTHLDRMTIFEYIPTSFHLGNFTATIHTSETILILDNGGTFGTQVSKHFLKNCIRSKDLYHCMEDSVYTRNVDDLCLVRLYKGNTKDIDSVCNVKLKRRKEIIQRLSSNSFRVLADSPQALITDCKRGVSNHPRKLTVRSSQTVSFNQTCRVTSNNYVFTTSVDLLDHTETLNMDLDIFEPLDSSFFHGFDEEELLKTFNTTRKTP